MAMLFTIYVHIFRVNSFKSCTESHQLKYSLFVLLPLICDTYTAHLEVKIHFNKTHYNLQNDLFSYSKRTVLVHCCLTINQIAQSTIKR